MVLELSDLIIRLGKLQQQLDNISNEELKQWICDDAKYLREIFGALDSFEKKYKRMKDSQVKNEKEWNNLQGGVEIKMTILKRADLYLKSLSDINHVDKKLYRGVIRENIDTIKSVHANITF